MRLYSLVLYSSCFGQRGWGQCGETVFVVNRAHYKKKVCKGNFNLIMRDMMKVSQI